MIPTLLRRGLDVVMRRPGATLLTTAVLTIVALGFGSRVELRTSRQDLAPPDEPAEQRWQRFLAEKPIANVLVAVVEAAPGATIPPFRLRQATDRLAASFREDSLAGEVFHRTDLAWFERHALHAASPAAIAGVVSAVGEGGVLRHLVAGGGVVALNEGLADALDEGTRRAEVPAEDATRSLATVAQILRFEHRFLRDPEAVTRRMDADAPLLSLVSAVAQGDSGGLPPGYVGSRDGTRMFITITPSSAADDLPVLTRFVGAMRARADRLMSENPDVRVAFTGQAALSVDEMALVRRDATRSSVLAAVGVALLIMVGFRWRVHAFMAFVALMAGLLWTLGAVWFAPGYLNLITTAVIPTLLGVGVAFGIHPISEYELAPGREVGSEAALHAAFRETLMPVTVSALTTAAAFFAILLIPFRGFAELGLVAGLGVVLCLGAAYTVLPALLTVHGRRRRARESGQSEAPVHPEAHFDRVWSRGAAAAVSRYPRVVVAVAAGLTAVLALGVTRVKFDPDLLGLLPRDAEAVRYQEIIARTSDLSPFFAVVEAESLTELRTLKTRAESDPAIGRFESVLDVIPADTLDTALALTSLGEALATVRVGPAVPRVDRDALRLSLERLEGALERAAEDAFGSGRAELAAVLEEAREAAAAAGTELQGGAPLESGVLEREWDTLHQWIGSAVASARAAADNGAPTVAGLPAELRERYLVGEGRLLAYLHPSDGDGTGTFGADQGPRFAAAALEVSPNATGFPIVFQRMTARITEGFYETVGVGALLVLVILLAHFRRMPTALMASMPLALGILWTLGIQGWFDIPFNFANLVAIPLVIGVGIDDGVHLVHRARLQGMMDIHAVLLRSGRAILITSLATVAGFGSLIFSAHRGMASLGTLLVIGVVACLVASIVVLPNVMLLTRAWRPVAGPLGHGPDVGTAEGR